MDYAIVAIGYNRRASLARLLESIENAYYDNDTVTLYISIDNSGSKEVEDMARGVQWSHGEKIILTYPERQGLRKHVLQCGNLVEKYNAIAVLEDDVVVAPGFYHFMKAAVEKYYNNSNVAGISLYNYEWNEFASLPFEPALSQYDAYFIQTVSSWGQIWLRNQWLEFQKWYVLHNEEFRPSPNIPKAVSGWPATSWKKYHIKYCIETNKYFVFPYKALSTNFSDEGTHCKHRYSFLQVSMLVGDKKDYLLPELNDADAIIYDGFFERRFCGSCVENIPTNCLCIDLYGTKEKTNKRYWLTSKVLPYKIIKKYGYSLKPQEQNFVSKIPGSEMFLYDKSIKQRNRLADPSLEIFRYRFNLVEKTRMLARCILDSHSEYFANFITKLRKGKQGK